MKHKLIVPCETFEPEATDPIADYIVAYVDLETLFQIETELLRLNIYTKRVTSVRIPFQFDIVATKDGSEPLEGEFEFAIREQVGELINITIAEIEATPLEIVDENLEVKEKDWNKAWITFHGRFDEGTVEYVSDSIRFDKLMDKYKTFLYGMYGNILLLNIKGNKNG